MAGTRAEDVIAVLRRIDQKQRNAVEEVTLDLSDSMRLYVRYTPRRLTFGLSILSVFCSEDW